MIVTGDGLTARVIKDEIYPGGVITEQAAGRIKKIEKAAHIINSLVSDVDAVLKNIEITCK